MYGVKFMDQLDIDIRKLKKQISKIRKKESEYKDNIDSAEEKMIKLQRSLSKAAGNFSEFDRLNASFKSLTQLRFVNTWIDARAEQSKSEIRKAYVQMDAASNAQREYIKGIRMRLDNIEGERKKLEIKLKYLEDKKRRQPKL